MESELKPGDKLVVFDVYGFRKKGTPDYEVIYAEKQNGRWYVELSTN